MITQKLDPTTATSCMYFPAPTPHRKQFESWRSTKGFSSQEQATAENRSFKSCIPQEMIHSTQCNVCLHVSTSNQSCFALLACIRAISRGTKVTETGAMAPAGKNLQGTSNVYKEPPEQILEPLQNLP